MRVVYIEDNPNDAQLVARYLKTTPHQLVVAANLHEARAAMDNPVDLLLVDVLLDNTRGGFDFALQLRQQGFNRPMIAVTALTTPQDIADCADVGFNAVLTKPFQITELADLIHRYL